MPIVQPPEGDSPATAKYAVTHNGRTTFRAPGKPFHPAILQATAVCDKPNKKAR